ncbi:MAG: hypothetical protein P9M08_02050 [Candidatus Erginobacter occultus]|nr:hypothetical protein [Candidatus Erginobacter occultus]
MFEPGNEDILEYCFGFMISKEQRLEFLQRSGIDVKTSSLSCRKAARRLREAPGFTITVGQAREFMREKWTAPDIGMYIETLESGRLCGHDWHGAMPSFLHRSFQQKARAFCSGEIGIDEYLDTGMDIVRHELFIILTHDLCEAHIIKSFPDVIPSIANRGVTDFIFNGLPFDLKASGLPAGWTLGRARETPLEFAISLYSGADTERLRSQAAKSINDWGLNRFYVIATDPDAWLREPRTLLDQLASECGKVAPPMSFEIDGLNIACKLVFIG